MGLMKLLIPTSAKKRLEMHMFRTIRRLIRSYSRGDAHLYLGRYITSKDAEIKRKRVMNYKFS